MNPGFPVRIVMLLLTLVWAFRLPAQDDFAVTGYTTRDGLPHNQVRSIAQDSSGFIWIATWDGLSRFDGYEFRNYYHDPDDSTSIPYFSVEKIVVDKYNNVWINSIGHDHVIYDRAHDRFIRGNEEQDEKLVRVLAIDHRGEIWDWNSRNGMEKYDYAGGRFVPVTLTFTEGSSSPFTGAAECIPLFDNRGNPWVLARWSSGVDLFRGTLTAPGHLLIDATPYTLPSGFLANCLQTTHFRIQLYTDASGSSWMLSNCGILQLEPGSRKWRHAGISDLEQATPDHAVFTGSPDNLRIQILGTPGGRIRQVLLPEGHHLVEYLRDRQGTLWFSGVRGSGEGTGLSRAVPVSGLFRHYFLEKETADPANAFFGVLKDQRGRLWAIPRNLPHLLSQDSTGRITPHYPLEETIRRQVGHARAMLADSAGIWIGYYHHMLVRYDFRTQRFHRFITGKVTDPLAPDRGFKHLAYHQGQLLAAGDFGVDLIDPLTGQTRRVFSGTPVIYALKRDASGNYWLGSNYSHLVMLDPHLAFSKEYRVTRQFFNIEDVEFGEEGILWLALLGGGLCRFDPVTNQSVVFTTADGLANNTCYSILKDRQGTLWITTNQGLSRFFPTTGRFRNYGPSDGLQINEFNSDAAFVAPDGTFFFGGMGGVVSFHPDAANMDSARDSQAPLLITDLRTEGNSLYFQRALYELDTVRLPRGTLNVELSFASLDFPWSDKIRYRYRLGHEEKWRETSHRRRDINYAHLTPGEYHFELEATNADGEWAAATALTFIIPPQFHQTTLFRLMVAFLILMIPVTFFFGSYRRIKLKAEQQLDELRLQSLRSQMNPHFIFNSLNSVNYFISQNDRLSANRYISGFARLIRNILENLSSDYIPLSREIESLRDYLQLEHLRFGDRFDYFLDTSDIGDAEGWLVFPGLIQPFLENAIWHGVRGLKERKGILTVRMIRNDAQELTCIIEDDGAGRSKAAALSHTLPGKTSRGIAIVAERLQTISKIRKHHYTMTITDAFPEREETGTRVILALPVKHGN